MELIYEHFSSNKLMEQKQISEYDSEFGEKNVFSTLNGLKSQRNNKIHKR